MLLRFSEHPVSIKVQFGFHSLMASLVQSQNLPCRCALPPEERRSRFLVLLLLLLLSYKNILWNKRRTNCTENSAVRTNYYINA